MKISLFILIASASASLTSLQAELNLLSILYSDLPEGPKVSIEGSETRLTPQKVTIDTLEEIWEVAEDCSTEVRRGMFQNLFSAALKRYIDPLMETRATLEMDRVTLEDQLACLSDDYEVFPDSTFDPNSLENFVAQYKSTHGVPDNVSFHLKEDDPLLIGALEIIFYESDDYMRLIELQRYIDSRYVDARKMYEILRVILGSDLEGIARMLRNGARVERLRLGVALARVEGQIGEIKAMMQDGETRYSNMVNSL